MTKTRDWPVRAMYMLIAAALVISLIIVAAPITQKVAADPGLSEWGEVSIPSPPGWVLAPGFIIGGFAVGTDALYVIGTGYEDNDPTKGIIPQLLKSTDGAATWKDIFTGLTEEVDEQGLGGINALVNVTCDYANPSFLAVALQVQVDGSLHVFLSNDGGTTFRDTGKVEAGGVDFPAAGVLKFVVSGELNGVRNIAIGGTNAAGNDALLFRCLAIGDVGTGWTDATAYNGWDNDGASSVAVVDISFAPSWATDYTILVLTVPDTLDNVYLQSGTWGTVEAWNDEAGFAKAVPIFTTSTIIPYLNKVAGINTPLDYSGQEAEKRYVWVNVNYWDAADSDGPEVGKIFRVINVSVMPINQQIEGLPWLTNVSYFGYISEGKAIASLLGDGTGALTDLYTGVQVYRNDSITVMDICCLAWEVAYKPPTGRLVMVAFYVSPAKAYAIALGAVHHYDESAWSVSFDDGDTWNQLSLVNTDLGGIIPEDWSFVFIADPHIGRTSESEWQKYKDYSSPGWDIEESGPDCITTENLRRILRRINDLISDGENIRFVVIGGDITDSGELSEFNKAIEVLNSELDIPWIPIPGNHDIRPFSQYLQMESQWDQANLNIAGWHYSDKFTEQYNQLSEDFPENWDKPTPGLENQWLQNFSFDYAGYHFIFLDFNSRERNENILFPGSGVGGELHNEIGGTWPWLINDINTYLLRQPSGSEDIILFAHHPFIHQDDMCFDDGEFNTIREDLEPYSDRIWGQFAGHTHNEDIDTQETTLWSNPPDQEIIMTVIEVNATLRATTEFPSVRLVKFADGELESWDLIGSWPSVLKVEVRCPVDLLVTDPDGQSIGTDVNEIPGAAYLSNDINDDGNLDDIVYIPERKTGDYLIQVIPEPDALPEDIYSLEAAVNGETIVLAEDVQISDIPSEPYVFNSISGWDPWVYDEASSGFIEIGDLLAAINDYIGGDITISQLLEIINLYISHTPRP